ncbi:LytTR family DNA-binding domain-containing protein [Kordia algicida OT-1]|uniref:Two-component system response regulator n=1 Tax=Kordia algicida OT-1 TaxID=391587 RepID=A9DKG3_9FLAO|nr:LytTR family DNA-binding domain-containing protein [Kordia algicida]EDP98320.1 two-component system response regulator [Kordia algicida OT-1]
MNCIIIEDEIPAQRILKSYIEKVSYLELRGTFNAALKAYDILNSEKIDLIFLDINLPDISGLSFLRTLKNPPTIIMTTAYPDYAVESFEFETIIDYLVKPFSLERFLKAIQKTQRLQTKTVEKPIEKLSPETLFLNVDKTFYKIQFQDIFYVESERNYLTLVSKQQKLSFIGALRTWKEKLPEQQFIQIHKSFVINKDHVDKITGNEVYIHDKRIPIGRTFKAKLFEVLDIT